jgi:hypothetical protein
MTAEDEQYLRFQGLPGHQRHVIELLMRHQEARDVPSLEMAEACEAAREFFQSLHDATRSSRFDPGA